MALKSFDLYNRIARGVVLKPLQSPNTVLNVGIFDENMSSTKQVEFITGLNRKIKESLDHEMDGNIKNHLKDKSQNPEFHDFYYNSSVEYEGY